MCLLGQFRSQLDKSFTFDFIDGPYISPLPPSLARVFTSAYTWVDKKDAASIRSTMDWLLQYMHSNGPYDCVCCFSKAAAVIVAILLYHGREPPETRMPLPFKSVVFMNASIEYSVLEDLGLPITAEARDIQRQTEDIVRSRASNLQNLANLLTLKSTGEADMWKDTSELLHDASVLPSPERCFGVNFTAFPSDVFIGGLPTVHIYGSKDPIWPSSIQVAYLCSEGRRKTYDHQGGHDVPRLPQVAATIAALFKQLAKETGQ